MFCFISYFMVWYGLKLTTNQKYFLFIFSVESGILLMDPPIIVDDDFSTYLDRTTKKTIVASNLNATRSVSTSSRYNATPTRYNVTRRVNGVHRSMSLNLRRPLSMSCISSSSSGLKVIMPGDNNNIVNNSNDVFSIVYSTDKILNYKSFHKRIVVKMLKTKLTIFI